jgi:phospholipase C
MVDQEMQGPRANAGFERRRFLQGTAALAGVAAFGGAASGCAPAPGPVVSKGNAADAGYDHIVVVMMENRSYDHFLGWLPGGDGRQAGLTFVDGDGVSHETHRLTEFAACDMADPGHSMTAGRIQYHDGAVDGFLFDAADTLPIGYFEQDQLLFWGEAAPAWTVCDNYFAATLGPTFPNRFFQHCGRTDRITNTVNISTLPTIWDRLADAGLQGRYYFSDAPFSALLGLRHLFITRTFDQFKQDAAAGRLANVSFVDPRFMLPTPFGTSGDYHPVSDIRAGCQFLHEVYEAVTNSPNWERTVLVVNFDEWGGFYDHVVPTAGPDASHTTALRGFRVPCLVASPLAKRGHVAHGLYDHTSVLKMIEWSWGLPPLAPRDAAANNLAEVLDLGGRPDLDVHHWTLPDFHVQTCAATWFDSIWKRVLASAKVQGFPV